MFCSEIMDLIMTTDWFYRLISFFFFNVSKKYNVIINEKITLLSPYHILEKQPI